MMLGGEGGGVGGGGGVGHPFEERMAMLAGIPLQVNSAPMPVPEMVGTGGGRAKGKERVPQWGNEEMRDLIAIRADLEQRDPAVSPPGKTLWEAAAVRMGERGHRRTPEQCKCKWKNLVNRYKGKETADADNGRQCPFFNELNAVFVERAKSMQRRLLESDSGAAQQNKKLKRLASSDDFSDDGCGGVNRGCEVDDNNSKPRRRKAGDNNRGKGGDGVQALLRELLQQQRRTDAQWQEMAERRYQERRAMQEQWKRTMEGLERERRAMEEVWRAREEERRAREESRAERREALLATLLNKLIQDQEL